MRTIKCYNFLKIEKENEKEEKVESIRHFCSIEVFKVLWRNNGYIYETILLFLRNSISFNQSSLWVTNFQNQSDFLSFITPLAYSLVSYDTAGETIHIFRVIIQFHLTNAFIPAPIFQRNEFFAIFFLFSFSKSKELSSMMYLTAQVS